MVLFISCISLLLVLLVVYMSIEAKRTIVIDHQVTFANFPETFGSLRVFFISDIHQRTITDRLLHKVKEPVDFVVIGGDLTEKGVPLSRVLHNIKQLKKLGPVYFVWGNNDYEVDYHELDALLLSENVVILDNTAVKLESDQGEHIHLLGVDDTSKKRADLSLALQDCDEDGFKMLISHNPSIIHKVKEEDQIDFILSGHTHGGQIRFFGLGPYELGGFKEMKGTKLFVSNGYGTTALPLRLGARAETHYLVISRTK
ncbi:metallophosphoesterase [Metabacillus iocasae]|uniref:MPP superfamily phosphohydrolase n=1 Tax=Priestia iocasae TaxID=2291674 RepID=A0ABS2QQH0_9BACI|nr:metallophosphoesterase [Metabacillus iocasae]MBM7701694.1 putative MPP superfamily phosphohydrolase [Metabacillus iocasae]